MLRFDCVHLKEVTNDHILENHLGSLKCAVDRAWPDSTHKAGINCPAQCERFHAKSGSDSTSAFAAIKNAFFAILGKG